MIHRTEFAKDAFKAAGVFFQQIDFRLDDEHRLAEVDLFCCGLKKGFKPHVIVFLIKKDRLIPGA